MGVDRQDSTADVILQWNGHNPFGSHGQVIALWYAVEERLKKIDVRAHHPTTPTHHHLQVRPETGGRQHLTIFQYSLKLASATSIGMEARAHVSSNLLCHREVSVQTTPPNIFDKSRSIPLYNIRQEQERARIYRHQNGKVCLQHDARNRVIPCFRVTNLHDL